MIGSTVEATLMERARLERAVHQACDQMGRQRFYPPGFHPACRRQREQIAALLRIIGQRWHGTPMVHEKEFLVWAQRQVDLVEAHAGQALQAFVEALR